MAIRWQSHACCLLVLWGAAAAAERHPIGGVDLLRMHKGGLNDATILDFIGAYQASLRVSEGELSALAEAGLKPDTLQALRDRALAPRPAVSADAEVGKDAKATLEAPLPRFFVGYPHDPTVFPSWYYGPFAVDSISGSQFPGRSYLLRGAYYAGAWRFTARSAGAWRFRGGVGSWPRR